MTKANVRQYTLRYYNTK